MTHTGHSTIGHAEIEAAARRIAPHVRETPVLALEAGALAPDAPAVLLKLECLQVTGSFKPRGAFNRILAAWPAPAAGVIAASGGNHGLAVAHAARRLGMPAEIFVPEIAAPAKLALLRALGARLHVGGATYAEAFAACTLRAAESGALMVHPYDQPEVLAGQGTLGRELERQVPEFDTLLVAVGGGGLIGGIAAWFAGRRRVVAVEPETGRTLDHALAAGDPVEAPVGGIAADSLGAREVGEAMYPIAAHYVAAALLVPDAAIRAAQRALWRAARVVAEPGGATALAALLAGAYRPEAGERVAVLVCGANCDPGSVAGEG